MDDVDIEQLEPLPVDRNGRRLRTEDQPDNDAAPGCCERFHHSVSRWMLPEDLRETYLERANCLPPPIFIILISIGEVALTWTYTTHILSNYTAAGWILYRFAMIVLSITDVEVNLLNPGWDVIKNEDIRLFTATVCGFLKLHTEQFLYSHESSLFSFCLLWHLHHLLWMSWFRGQ